MKIVVLDDSRYFLVSSEQEFGDLALKILNERRVMGALSGSLEPVVTQVLDELDGEFAIQIMARTAKVRVITPEPIR